ncbi:DUF3667 domain-containing protein [Mucilaginibacter sp.]|uniref:DUF3667 domain-containing protein n=1 Tax=Mucilaginibacter sp. TaxID=1882438 RepID=UPI0035BC198D
MPDCRNCNAVVAGKYCHDCGQPSILKRIDGHYIRHEIEHILHFERGIFYTVKGLFLKPGQTVRYFMTEDRSRLVKPVIFLIITSLIYSVINHFFHIEEGYVNYQETKKSVNGYIFEWVESHYGYSNIIMGVFIAMWLKLFFKKYQYNFFEILILLCFVMGMAMLIFTVFALVQGISHFKLLEIGGYAGVLYCSWAIGQFFSQKQIGSYVKALAAYLLGMATFTLLILAIGSVADLILKH